MLSQPTGGSVQESPKGRVAAKQPDPKGVCPLALRPGAGVRRRLGRSTQRVEPIIITTQGGTHHNHHFSLQWAFSLQWVVAWTGPSACTNQFVPVRWEERATLHRPEREEVCSAPEPCLCPRFFESLPTEDRPSTREHTTTTH